MFGWGREERQEKERREACARLEQERQQQEQKDFFTSLTAQLGEASSEGQVADILTGWSIGDFHWEQEQMLDSVRAASAVGAHPQALAFGFYSFLGKSDVGLPRSCDYSTGLGNCLVALDGLISPGTPEDEQFVQSKLAVVSGMLDSPRNWAAGYIFARQAVRDGGKPSDWIGMVWQGEDVRSRRSIKFVISEEWGDCVPGFPRGETVHGIAFASHYEPEAYRCDEKHALREILGATTPLPPEGFQTPWQQFDKAHKAAPTLEAAVAARRALIKSQSGRSPADSAAPK